MQKDTFARSRKDIIRLCHSGLDSQTLRVKVLDQLKAVVPFDYAYFTSTDPATQLITSSVTPEQPPRWLMPVFMENEFFENDFLKFRSMLKAGQTLGTLSNATKNHLDHSRRYQQILAPMNMGDELRAIFVTNSACWGTLCLQRSGPIYLDEEAAFVRSVSAHIADGLRKAILFDGATPSGVDGPGVLLLDEDLSVAGMNVDAEYWLSELIEPNTLRKHILPPVVRSVVSALLAIEQKLLPADFEPKVRFQTNSGEWLTLYSSRLMNSAGKNLISVIFDAAQPAEISPLILAAYNLTKRESEVTQYVLLGWSTAEISTGLHITTDTVQDHLKSIFGKVGVNSRGELTSRILYQPPSA